MKAKRPRSWLSRLRRQRGAREWSGIISGAGDLGPADRRDLQPEARALRDNLSQFLHVTQPTAQLSKAALESLSYPPGTDWCWRPGMLTQLLSPAGIAGPESGQRLGDHVALWHDCAENALILRQAPGTGATVLVPFSLTLEVLGFTGGYLSLSIDLPREALAGLSESHVIRLQLGLRAERAMPIFARLNVLHGPNTEQIIRELDLNQADQHGQQIVEFDMAGTELHQNRLEKIWLDLIFDEPRMNAIELQELIMSRHLRANF